MTSQSFNHLDNKGGNPAEEPCQDRDEHLWCCQEAEALSFELMYCPPVYESISSCIWMD